MTMILCFVELRGKVAMQWVVICLNLFVHVIMYYYYGGLRGDSGAVRRAKGLQGPSIRTWQRVPSISDGMKRRLVPWSPAPPVSNFL